MVLQSNFELASILQTLIPICNLSKDDIDLIVSGAYVKTVVKDKLVFSEGDNDDYAYYLLKGELKLISTDNTDFRILSETDGARYPLAQFQPRQYTARAEEDSLILCIDKILLDSLLIGNTTDSVNCNAGLEVNDIDNDEDEDWMTRILQSPLYTNISVENIQKIFSKIESINVKQGDVIINQGDDGDYYYIIQSGRCQISRKPTPTAQDINLAQIREGDAFGEEAIIANTKRNASVTMITDGRLMRLSKDDFVELILLSILQKVDFETAEAIQGKGAIWLDVRFPDEYQDYSIEGSVNIPLNLLRLQVGKLDKSRQYITCCDTGSRCSIAAFILAQHGYDVYQLNSGLKTLFRQVDKNKSEIVEPDRLSSADIIPFNKNDTSDENNTNRDNFIYDELNELRNELENIRGKFKEVLQIKDIASEVKKSVLDITDKKINEQRKYIDLQTKNANKLMQHAKKMYDGIEQERQSIYKVVEILQQKQEQAVVSMQAEINKHFLEEENKMQEFYAWKKNEIENINKMKKAAETEYLKSKIINKTGQNVQEQHEFNDDIKEWLAEQVRNESTPLNNEIRKAKGRIVQQADLRYKKARKISKIHDQTLSAEIDLLLKDSNK
jgi:CRP-like cAMP-binding protein